MPGISGHENHGDVLPVGFESDLPVRSVWEHAIEQHEIDSIAEQSIVFEEDPDFGYQVASSVPGLDDPEKLQPRRLYEAQGRSEDYDAIVERLKTERVAHLQQFTQLSEEIIKAVG